MGARWGATLGEKLLLLTPSLDQPIAVDPAAPILPAAALAGLSPYVSWSGWLLGREPPPSMRLSSAVTCRESTPRV